MLGQLHFEAVRVWRAVLTHGGPLPRGRARRAVAAGIEDEKSPTTSIPA